MIRKRATTPEKQSKGRHPMLKPGLAYTTMYNYIQLHPGCTREDISRQLGVPSNSVTGRVAELINEGLIRVAGWKVSPSTGKRIQTLEVYGSMSGNRNDRLQIDIEIWCDGLGNYHLTSSLRGEQKYIGNHAGSPVLCLKKTIGLTVTPPTKLHTSAKDNIKGGLTLEADYKIVS